MFGSKDKKQEQILGQKQNQLEQGTKVEGNIEAIGNLRIDGEVVGNVICKQKFVLGAEGVITGNITAKNAEIEGTIKGNLNISEMLVLRPSAVVEGDLITDKKIVEAGAVHNGRSTMQSPISSHNEAGQGQEKAAARKLQPQKAG